MSQYHDQREDMIPYMENRVENYTDTNRMLLLEIGRIFKTNNIRSKPAN